MALWGANHSNHNVVIAPHSAIYHTTFFTVCDDEKCVTKSSNIWSCANYYEPVSLLT